MKIKKILSIILVILSVMLLVSGIILFKNNNNNNTDTDTSTKYYCYLLSGNNDQIKIENTYEFTYDGEIKNIQRKFIVTYKNKSEYEESYYDNFFEESDKPDKIEENNDKLVKTYIWNNGLEGETLSLNSYIESLEDNNYECQIID